MRIFFLILCFFAGKTFSQKTELVVQAGHPAAINSVDISPDLQFIATASDDGMIRLFDLKSGFEVRKMDARGRQALQVRFSKNGKYITTSDVSGHTLWEAATGKRIMVIGIAEDSSPGHSLISPDQKYFYGNWEDNSVIQVEFANMFHTENENAINEDSSIAFDITIKRKVFTGHKGTLSAMAISHDSKYLITAATDKSIIIWDAVTGAIIKTITTDADVTSIAVAVNNTEFLTTNDDMDKSGITFYDIATGKVTRHIADKNDKSRSVVCSADGKYFAAGYLLGLIKLFDYSTGSLVRTFTGHTSWVNSIAIDPTLHYLVSAGNDNAVKLWNLQQGNVITSIQKNIQEINRVSFGDEHKLIALQTENEKADYNIRIWDLEKGNGFARIFNIPRLSNLGYSLDMDRAEKKIMANGDSGIYIWNPANGKLLDHIKKRTGAAAMHGNLVVYKDLKTRFVHVYDAASKKTSVLDTLKSLSHSSFTFSDDGKLLAGATIGPVVQVWDMGSKKPRHTLNYIDPDGTEEKESIEFAEPNAWVYAAKFSPDKKFLVTACRFPDPVTRGTDLLFWDVQSGKLLKKIIGGEFPIQAVNWSPDGKKIVTGGNGKTIVIWDAFSVLSDTLNEAEPDTVIDNDFTIMAASYTKDNKWLITGGIDGKLIIRDAKSMAVIVTVVVIDSVDYVIATPDNYYAASKNAARAIAFKQGNKIFPFQQFDLQYNRPDIILERLGMASTDLIKAYKSAYQKRLKKVGFNEEMFNKDFHMPGIKITTPGLPLTTTVKELSVQLQAEDSKYKLDRLEIVANGVPVYGIAGLSLRDKNISSITTDVTLELLPGKNKIEASVLNDKGVESMRETIYINYTPLSEEPSKIYFIGIGINTYKDGSMNLKYAAKDIRDLAKIFAKYPGSSVDTFINETATKENILAIKEKLLKTSTNDKVIISASGHGLLDKNLDFYYATSDIDFKNPSVRGLLYDDLENLLDAIPARKKLLLIDACHSGEVDREEKVTVRDNLPVGVKAYAARGATDNEEASGIGLQNIFELMKELFSDLSKGNGAIVVSAAGGFEYALEDAKYNNGVFTYSIKKAMEQSKMPLSVYRLKDYVSQQVEKLTNGKQKPTSRKENAEFDWSF